jgi:hypothetical protein
MPYLNSTGKTRSGPGCSGVPPEAACWTPELASLIEKRNSEKANIDYQTRNNECRLIRQWQTELRNPIDLKYLPNERASCQHTNSDNQYRMTNNLF